MSNVTGVVTLTDFLLARIAEDEADARSATPAPWRPNRTGRWDHDNFVVTSDLSGVATQYALTWSPADAAHISRHDPARVLAECEAKRRIVGERLFHDRDPDYELTILGARILGALALPYAEHPDYDESWRP